MILELVPRVLDAETPAIAAQDRLELPLEQVQQQDGQAIHQFALLAAAHGLDLFRDILDIGLASRPARNSAACCVGPGVEVLIVETVRHRRLLSAQPGVFSAWLDMGQIWPSQPASERPADGLRPDRRTAADPRRGAEALRPLRRRLLAGARPHRDVPGGILRRHGRGQLAGHRHAGGIWRRRARHHRGGDPDAGGGRIGRLHVGRLGHPPQHLRPQSGRGVRHRGAEAPHAAAGDRRPRQGLLRRHRAECRPQHHADHHARRAARRPLRDQRHQDLDLHRAGREQDPAAGAHHAAGSGASGTAMG